ncbi:MAG: hypothetical protein M3015_03610 [Bacteroidota bacterium]|nr:hypothetical protein [Bacteroidota bacterium]
METLKAFMYGKTDLPEKVFFIVSDDGYASALDKALPVLSDSCASVIFFIPVLIATNKVCRHIQVQLHKCFEKKY